jgi:hypothetical protein
LVERGTAIAPLEGELCVGAVGGLISFVTNAIPALLPAACAAFFKGKSTDVVEPAK